MINRIEEGLIMSELNKLTDGELNQKAHQIMKPSDKFLYVGNYPDYCNRIGEVFKLVKFAESKGIYCKIDTNGVSCSFYQPLIEGDKELAFVFGNGTFSLPKAITKAFILAFEEINKLT